jgi:hypothetical protein
MVVNTTSPFGTLRRGVEGRGIHFLTTSPNEAQNRRRLIFFLVVFFLACILWKLIYGDASTVELVKTFTSTIIWLVGIYVGGTVAATAVGEPQVREAHVAQESTVAIPTEEH